MDFSGWLGKIDHPKDFLIIGAEPHICKNYQVVYGFGTNSEENINTTAIKYADDQKDIWHYILKNFNTDQSDIGKIDFLKKCYITDLCHIVPKNCGTVDSTSRTPTTTTSRTTTATSRTPTTTTV